MKKPETYNGITKRLILIVTTVAAFLSAFGVSSVSIALPTIGKEFLKTDDFRPPLTNAFARTSRKRNHVGNGSAQKQNRPFHSLGLKDALSDTIQCIKAATPSGRLIHPISHSAGPSSKKSFVYHGIP